MKSDMQRNKVDINNLTISDLGIYASPNAALKLSTLHNAKGREYDAVALIDMHEGANAQLLRKVGGRYEEQSVCSMLELLGQSASSFTSQM